MNFYKKALLLLAICTCTEKLWAQNSDFGISNDISLEKRISKTFAVKALTSTTFLQNVQEWAWTFADAGLVLRLTRNWQFSGNYRYVWRQNLRNATVTRQMLYAQVVYAKSLGNFTVSWRGRLLRQWYGATWNDNYRPTLWQLRNRAGLQYKGNYYWQPYLSAEVFMPLNGQYRVNITQWRTTMGLDYNPNDFNEVSVYLQFNRTVNRSPNTGRLLLGTAYAIRL
ncbi:DUF2490 domain-containing protein [Sphingobacteriales bacterium UPWRP_1]|nr:hypothetical protein B6N25_09730 [Sphingobacteriales bacterium TSM_CSS]PSJ74947.1 DUF2490 domain-containing protein [Sphingobacteriales bacterium UPWRP_1]